MKNIELLQSREVAIQPHIENATYCVLTESNRLFVQYSNCVQRYNLETNSCKAVINEEVLCMSYWHTLDKVCLTTSNKLILQCPNSDIGSCLPFDADILFSAGCPNNNTVLIIGNDFHIRSVVIDGLLDRIEYVGDCDILEVAKDRFVNVGWGSTTTQFHGAAGKSKAQEVTANGASKREQVQNELPYGFTVTWNADGKLFALGYRLGDGNHFKIFTNSCSLLHQGQDMDGLQLEFAWRPESPVLIAGHVHNEKEHFVVFFERNGLYKSRFDLRTLDTITKLEWSPCGQILAVCHQDSLKNKYINLWTPSNYQWYLKQSLRFMDENPLQHFAWTSATIFIKTLTCITANSVTTYLFKFKYHRNENANKSLVAVIDGCQLKITNFSKENIAPPEASIVHNFDSEINFLTFRQDDETLLVVLANNVLIYLLVDKVENKIFEKLTINLNDTFAIRCPLAIQHFASVSDRVCFVTLIDEKKTLHSMDGEGNYQLLKEMSRLANYASVCNAIRQEMMLNDKDKLFYESDEYCSHSDEFVEIFTFPIENDNVTLSLTCNNRLFYYDKLLEFHVVAFMVYKNYLILVTTDNQLVTVHLTHQNRIDLLDICKSKSVCIRPVEEKGSKIVSCISGTSKVILQAPRGNLETITVRKLAIDVIEEYLLNHEWLKAFTAMRIEHLNMNLFIDLNPQRFLNNIDNFIRQVHSVRGLSIFALELQDKNVLETIYPNCSPNVITKYPGKKDEVLKLIVDYIKLYNFTYYAEPVITCLYLLNDISGALSFIKQIMLGEMTQWHVLKTSALKALKYLTVFVAAETLYDESLKMYDLELALLIAQNCNMDPIVYIPFLNKLKCCSPLYLRFKINDSMKNYKQAVFYLCACTTEMSIKDICNYIVKNKFYRYAIQCTNSKTNQTLRKYLCVLYAKHLSSLNKHEEAVYFYREVEFYSHALDEYVILLNFPLALHMCNMLNKSNNETDRYLSIILNGLDAKGQYEECAQLCLEHFSEYEKAVHFYVKGQNYTLALQLAKEQRFEDLIESCIKPSIKEAYINMMGDISNMKRTFADKVARLQHLRSKGVEEMKAEAMRRALRDEGNPYEEEEHNYDDLISNSDSTTASVLSGSSSGRFSKKSNRSSRKADIKKYSCKSGSLYEDIGLMRALHQLIEKAYKLCEEVRTMCFNLFETGGISGSAFPLHEAMKQLLKDIQENINVIWNPKMDLWMPMDQDTEYTVMTKNLKHLELQYRYPPYKSTSPWEIYSFVI